MVFNPLRSATDLAKIGDYMVLRVQGAVPGSDPASHEYGGQVSYTPETAQKLTALSHNSPKMF